MGEFLRKQLRRIAKYSPDSLRTLLGNSESMESDVQLGFILALIYSDPLALPWPN